MSGEFDSRKDSHSTKFEQRPRILVKVSFRELCDSKLSGLHAFDNMAMNICLFFLPLGKKVNLESVSSMTKPHFSELTQGENSRMKKRKGSLDLLFPYS